MFGLLGYNIPFGSLFGIPIKINVLLPLFVGLQCLTVVLNNLGGMAVLWAFIVFGLVLFSSVLIHELGHSLAARSVGGDADQIIMWPLGGLAFLSHDAGPKGDLWVTFAGPLTHIPQAAVWYAIGQVLDPGVSYKGYGYDENSFGESVVWTAFWLNLLLMAFNLLLPAYPLDGGRILVDLMLIVGVPANITAWITITIAAIMAVGLIVLGIWSFGYGFIIVGVFILINTFQLYQALSSGNITYHPLFKPTSKSSGNNQQAASNV